jgi:hypothetical protein
VLPDGILSNQKSQFGKILEGLAMEDVGIFMTFLSILWPNGSFNGHLVHFVAIWYIFPLFGILHREKTGNPAFGIRRYYVTPFCHSCN